MSEGGIGWIIGNEAAAGLSGMANHPGWRLCWKGWLRDRARPFPFRPIHAGGSILHHHQRANR
ncbi:hypothetical protein [Paludisphaera borealis]|uniref:hypothetical protein n=1 Tax=Paludisphaera borealis TaxID=1387353 RepID=UPI00097068F2|nr:hypothetical protein [Paludisphaera borealis]